LHITKFFAASDRTYSNLIPEPPEKTPFCDSRLGKISPLLGALGTKRQFFNAYNNIWLPPVQILAVFGHQKMKFFGVIQEQTGTLRRKSAFRKQSMPMLGNNSLV
jgi:hypothetical protein